MLLPTRLGLPTCAYGGKASLQLYVSVRMATRVPGNGTHCPVSAALPGAPPRMGACARLGDSGTGLPAPLGTTACLGGYFSPPLCFLPPRKGVSLIARVPV